jgi:hypothetical protein
MLKRQAPANPGTALLVSRLREKMCSNTVHHHGIVRARRSLAGYAEKLVTARDL